MWPQFGHSHALDGPLPLPDPPNDLLSFKGYLDASGTLNICGTDEFDLFKSFLTISMFSDLQSGQFVYSFLGLLHWNPQSLQMYIFSSA